MGLLRYVNAVFREITNIFSSRDRSVVTSSVIPSAKYCCSRSSLRLVNGSTTIDRRGAITPPRRRRGSRQDGGSGSCRLAGRQTQPGQVQVPMVGIAPVDDVRFDQRG